MGRSRWKLSFFSNLIWRRLLLFKRKFFYKNKSNIFYNRSSHIPKCFNNINFRIYKGNNFRRLLVNFYNVGYKFGEFSFSRKPFHFPIKKSNKKKNLIYRK